MKDKTLGMQADLAAGEGPILAQNSRLVLFSHVYTVFLYRAKMHWNREAENTESPAERGRYYGQC